MTATPNRDRSGPVEADPDERYAFVDVRNDDPDDPDDDVDLGDDDETPARRPRPRTRRKTPARGKTSSRKTPARRGGRGRRSSEFAIGALLAMAFFGWLAYWLTYKVAGYPRDFSLVCAGLAAGLSTWTGRGWTTLRRHLARTIAPKGGR